MSKNKFLRRHKVITLLEMSAEPLPISQIVSRTNFSEIDTRKALKFLRRKKLIKKLPNKTYVFIAYVHEKDVATNEL